MPADYAVSYVKTHNNDQIDVDENIVDICVLFRLK